MTAAPVACERCGASIAADALFCPSCGTPRARGNDPLCGEVIGDRWLLLERLGHGGSGTIYRAEHVTLRRRVAVKILHHELSRDDLAIERFRREATTVSEIDNEHIVEVFDFGRARDGRLFLAMELLDGEQLSTTLQREGRLPIAQVVDILAQTGEALMEAHAMGYVHRDLRPGNIFLARPRARDRGGEVMVKLLDFGLAKLVETEGEAASTNLGMTFGDPRYMSPEQARGAPLDRRADIYSLGVIAYEMLIGQPPFTGKKVFDVLSQHIERMPRSPASVRADVPPWLDTAVMRALAKKPEERFITVYRLVEALREGARSGAVMGDDAAQSMPPVAPPPPAPRSREQPAAPEPDASGDGLSSSRPVSMAAISAQPVASAPAAASAPPASVSSQPARSPAATSTPMTASGMWYASGDSFGDPATESSLPASPREKTAKTVVKKPAPKPRRSESRRTEAAGLDDDWELPPRRRVPRWAFFAAGGAALVLVALLVWASMRARGDKIAAAPDAGAPALAAVAADAGPVARAATPPDAAPPPKRPQRAVAAPPARTTGDDPPAAPLRAVSVSDADRAQADFFVKLGQAKVQDGDHVGAAAHFNKAREHDPRNAEALAGLGHISLLQGSFQDAAAHLEAAARLAPKSARIHTLRGKAWLGAGDADKAAASFKRALKIDPDHAEARRGYEEALAKGGS